MTIGDTIRKYRKEKGLTQEQLAERLGVTAPAVNKWERGSTAPDIALLVPIARLLGITTDTLLSFQAEPTQEQINELVGQIGDMPMDEPFETVMEAARALLRRWPGSAVLRLRLGQIMEARRVMIDLPDESVYDGELSSWMRDALDSPDPALVRDGACMLYALALRREEYGEAEKYLTYLPEQDPQRKRMQADIFAKTGREDEAYQALEELLFSENSMLSSIFASLYMLAMGQNDRERARYYEEKRAALARVFEMGAYHECTGLELAMMGQDADAAMPLIETMLRRTESIFGFTRSPLFAHMDFRDTEEERFITELRRDLIANFQSEEFLREDPRFQALAAEFED